MRLFQALRAGLFASTLVAGATFSQSALAKEEAAKQDSAAKRKVAVGGFEGAKSDDVRSAFIAALKKAGDYEVTDAEDVKPGTKDAAIAESAKGLGVSVVITGKVKKGFTLALQVRNGSDGSVIEDVELKGGALGKLKKNIEKSGVEKVAGPIGQAKVPEPPKEEPKEEEAPKEDEAPAEDAADASGGGASPLDITAGLRPYNRNFTFNQSLADVRPGEGFHQLLKYELPLGPALFIDLNLYPLALLAPGTLDGLGITGGFEKGFATQSVYDETGPNPITLKTDFQAWYVGARFRHMLSEHQLSIAAAYGKQQFLLAGDEVFPLLPDVNYTFVRVGVDGLFRFGEVLAGVRVGTRVVLGTGPLEEVWFPKASAKAIEGGFTLGYRLASMLDLVAGFDWLQYGLTFDPEPGKALNGDASNVAGGAVDRYLAGHIGFRFHVPGKAGDGSAAPTSLSTEASTE